MSFKYLWKNNEANFGSPDTEQVEGGTHITFEIVLRKNGKYVALRRPKGIPEHPLPPGAKDYPEGQLYFCHNLIRYGETTEECVSRIVKDQAGVGVESCKCVYLSCDYNEDENNWGVIPHFVAELVDIPRTSDLVTEVIVFDLDNVPTGFAWWEPEDFQELLTDA